jgi:hypothetical protein
MRTFVEVVRHQVDGDAVDRAGRCCGSSDGFAADSRQSAARHSQRIDAPVLSTTWP